MARNYEALLGFIAERSNAPFAWGSNDCVSFAVGAVHAMTGRRLRVPQWHTERGATRVLKRLGGLEAAADSLLSRIPVARAARGDIGAVRTSRGVLLVVIVGDTVVGPDLDGLRRLSRNVLTAAWSAT